MEPLKYMYRLAFQAFCSRSMSRHSNHAVSDDLESQGHYGKTPSARTVKLLSVEECYNICSHDLSSRITRLNCSITLAKEVSWICSQVGDCMCRSRLEPAVPPVVDYWCFTAWNECTCGCAQGWWLTANTFLPEENTNNKVLTCADQLPTRVSAVN